MYTFSYMTSPVSILTTFGICGEVGLVIRLHLLSGQVRSVTTALKVVEEVQEGLHEIERE